MAIRAIVTKCHTKFTLLKTKPPTRLSRVRTEENIATLSPSIKDDHHLPIRRRSQQLTSVAQQRVKFLGKHLVVKPFKVQLVQKLKPNDLPQHRIFGEWALGKLGEDSLLYRKIVFSNEAYFRLNVYVNKQNWRFQSEGEPEALQKLPMHSKKVTVWCALWAGGIIGPYCFKDAANCNVTVNGERCREMISKKFFFCPKCKSLIRMTCNLGGKFVNILFHVRDRSIDRLDRAI